MNNNVFFIDLETLRVLGMFSRPDKPSSQAVRTTETFAKLK